MPGGQNGCAYLLFGLVGAGLLYGLAWILTAIAPFVPTLRWGSTAAWVVGIAGLFGGYLLCQVSLQGWDETRRSWASWAMFLIPIAVIAAALGWFIGRNRDAAWFSSVYELGERLMYLMPSAWIATPVIAFLAIIVWVIYRHNRNRGSG